MPDSVPTLEVKKLHPAAMIPRRMTEHAAGLDLAACLPEGEKLLLAPGERASVPTGIALAPPGRALPVSTLVRGRDALLRFFCQLAVSIVLDDDVE